MKLLALVVLFRIEPEASESLLSLAKQHNSSLQHLVIWDNSPTPCSIIGKEWLNRNFTSYDYHHSPENQPLSFIYNEVIDNRIRQHPGSFSHLLLLDQDSFLEPTFLGVAAQAIQDFPDLGLFLPLVKASGHIVSPAHLFYFKGIYWRRPRLGAIRFRYKTAINSGMIIGSNYFLSKFSRYPNTLSFYGTDSWFCEQYAKDEKFACVFDSTITHDLSSFKVESVDVKLWRHQEVIRGLRIMNSSGFLRRHACNLFTVLTCMRMALRFRDRRFLAC
ncbi:MAG TPA: hypothetical protein VIJ38_00260 [Acidobacteriaceae bacterium]